MRRWIDGWDFDHLSLPPRLRFLELGDRLPGRCELGLAILPGWTASNEYLLFLPTGVACRVLAEPWMWLDCQCVFLVMPKS